MVLSTGNAIVDEISQMNINSIPELWYLNIRKGTTPNAMAILILWDILYWYKWSEVRDEASGMIIARKKKFADKDWLQRSNEQIGQKFGISKKVARENLDFLESLGLIKRYKKTVRTDMGFIPNVLFIAVCPDMIKKFSFDLLNDKTDSDEVGTETVTDRGQRQLPSGHEDSDPQGTTNTINTTNTTTDSTTTTSTSSSHSEPTPFDDDTPNSTGSEDSLSVSSSSPNPFDDDDIKTATSSKAVDSQPKVTSSTHSAKQNEKAKPKSSKGYPNEYYKTVYDTYMSNYRKLIDTGKLKTPLPKLAIMSVKGTLKRVFDAYGYDTILKAVRESVTDDWLIEHGYVFHHIFGEKKLVWLINGIKFENKNNSATNSLVKQSLSSGGSFKENW